MLNAMALGELSFAAPRQQSAAPQSVEKPDPPRTDLPALPAVPAGVTTILGGAIQNVDPVLDEF